MRARSPRLAASVVAAALLPLVAPANAKSIYAMPAKTGVHGGDGSAGAPFQNLQDAIDALAAGDTLLLKGGAYELPAAGLVMKKSGTSAAPIVITVAPGETPVIKGSHTIDPTVDGAWANDGGAVWKIHWTTPSQQVFVDDAALQQIGQPAAPCWGDASPGDKTQKMLAGDVVGSDRSTMKAGSFFWSASTLYVWSKDGSDPSKHRVEASITPTPFELEGAQYVTLRGLTFRHSNKCEIQSGGAAIQLGSFCRVESCDVQWMDFAGVAMGYREHDTAVVDSIVSNNGDEGIGASEATNVTIARNVFENNDYRGFNPSWGSGGMKLVPRCSGVIEKNVVRNNRGPGIWLDTDYDASDATKHTTIRDNYVAGNHDVAGIMVEVSAHVLVHDNLIVGNDLRGIYVSASTDVQVLHNSIVGNAGTGGGSSAVDVSGDPTRIPHLSKVTVVDNLIADNTSENDLYILQDGPNVSELVFDHNLVWRPSGSVVLRMSSGPPSYTGPKDATVAKFATDTKKYCVAGCVQADPKLLFAPTGKADDLRLSAGSPAIDVAIDALALDPSKDVALGFDYVGTKRPYGTASDLGAFEWTPTAPAPDAGPSDGGAADAASVDAADAVASDARAVDAAFDGAIADADDGGAADADSSSAVADDAGGCGCRTASSTEDARTRGLVGLIVLAVVNAGRRRRR